ncbi:MAG: hypothetical protein KBS35_00450, partial [Mycoplasma sp.]|nr:hypothetical protein [Candidatus Hennigella equi]
YRVKEVHDIYCSKLQENLDVFAQDYYWSKSWAGTSFEQFLFWQQLIEDELEDTNNNEINLIDRDVLGAADSIYNKDIETIKDLSMTTQTVEWEESEWTIPMLSFTIKFNSDVRYILFRDLLIDDEPVSGSIGGKVAGEIKFYNVPFYIISRAVRSETSGIVQQIISFEPFYEWMCGDIGKKYPAPHWRIETVVKSTISGEVSYSTGGIQTIADDWTLNVVSDENNNHWYYGQLSLEQTIGCVFTSSYYLEKVQMERE